MATMGESNRVEPVVECPYCGEPIFRRALYGHVSALNDDNHGARGVVPDGYGDQTPNIVEYVQVNPRAEREPPESRVLCRYCYKTFNGEHGLDVHIGMKAGDEDHPDGITAGDAALPLSLYGEMEPPADEQPEPTQQPEPAESPGGDLAEFRSRLKSMTRDPGEDASTGAESIPVDALLELLNDLRERESESAAYVTSANMLHGVLEEHGALTP